MKKRKKKNSQEEEGMEYEIRCKDCENLYVGETKFTSKQKKEATLYRMLNSAIVKHVEQTGHTIDWRTQKYCKWKKDATKKNIGRLSLKNKKKVVTWKRWMAHK